MDEIELKLLLASSSADQVKASKVLPRTSRIVQQHATYFDTADRALAMAGMSLRIRQSGKTRIQTIKVTGNGAAGLFARSEWEMPVQDNVPVLDDATPLHPLLEKNAGQLLRVFEVEVERRIWDVEEGDATIEVVLDRGTIRAGDRQTQVCELELEIRSGPPEAAFHLARRLDAQTPLRLGVLTKSERGDLLSQALRSFVKAKSVPLEKEMTAATALQTILQAGIKQFRLNEDLLLASRLPEPLHQARVALRRMRSAFSTFKGLLGVDAARDVRDGLRELAAGLGHARDLDVLLQRARPGPLQDRLRSEREAGYDRVEEQLRSARTRALMLELVEWVHCGPWLTDPDTEKDRNLPARTFASHALDSLRRKVKKKGRNFRKLDDEARHELRKATKKLRYATDFFELLFQGKKEKSRQRKFLAALKDVQDQLGALNDLATAPQVLDRLGISGDPEASTLLVGGRKKALIAAAADAHDGLMNAPRYWR
jgi:triphosphatase